MIKPLERHFFKFIIRQIDYDKINVNDCYRLTLKNNIYYYLELFATNNNCSIKQLKYYIHKWQCKHKFLTIRMRRILPREIEQVYFIYYNIIPLEYRRLIPKRVVYYLGIRGTVIPYLNENNINNFIYNKKPLEKHFFKYIMNHVKYSDFIMTKRNNYYYNNITTTIPFADIMDNFVNITGCNYNQLVYYLYKWNFYDYGVNICYGWIEYDKLLISDYSKFIPNYLRLLK